MRSDPVTTDGWRGLPGHGWPEPAMLAILAGLADAGLLGSSPVAGFDGRAGSRELAVLGCDLLAGLGIRCLLGDEPAPTPALGRFVRDNPGISSGLAFTASHNPPGYTGLKLRDRDGLSSSVAPPEPVPAAIPASSPEPARVPLNAHYAATAGRQLLGALEGFGGQLIIDGAHGALGSLARHLPLITWSRQRPLPFFAGATPDPVIQENTTTAWKAALSAGPPERLLMAFTDGDGDRLVLTTARSGYISSTEQAGIICLAGVPASTMIATVVTSRMVRHVAESADMGWAETAVGFKHVVAAWRARGRPSAIGLEPNGALAYAAGSGDYFERDALRALALVIQLLPSVWAIDDAVAALRARHPNRPEIMTSPQQAAEVLRCLSGTLRGWDLTQDGQLSSFTNGAWRVLARPSGTETVTRVYAEAPPEIIQAVRTALSQPPAPGD